MLEDCKLNEQLPSLENNSNKMIEECSTIVSRNRQESLCQIIVTVFRASNYVLFSSQSKTPMSWLIVIRERTRRKSLDAKEDYIRDQSKRSGICLHGIRARGSSINDHDRSCDSTSTYTVHRVKKDCGGVNVRATTRQEEELWGERRALAKGVRTRSIILTTYRKYRFAIISSIKKT